VLDRAIAAEEHKIDIGVRGHLAAAVATEGHEREVALERVGERRSALHGRGVEEARDDAVGERREAAADLMGVEAALVHLGDALTAGDHLLARGGDGVAQHVAGGITFGACAHGGGSRFGVKLRRRAQLAVCMPTRTWAWRPAYPTLRRTSE
jgi:hypothetical protein